MYAEIQEAKENIQGYRITGTVGDVPFSQRNLTGPFTVSNKASNPSTFNLGNASIGQLSGTFSGLNIDRNAWRGKYIEATIEIGENEIPLPAKRYKIDQAEHVNGMVKITAYDDMALFEKAAAVTVGTSGSASDFLEAACQDCGVEFGMTTAQVEALPNGDMPLQIYELGDIETWRDLLYWVGVTLCSFAFINREGKLELRAFHNTTDDTVPANARYDGAVYDDEVVTYTGLYVNVTEEEAVKYYHTDPDNGYTLTIGTNPFLQGGEFHRNQLATGIAEGMAGISYISGKIEVPFGFHYDLGDVLVFPGGAGSATNKFCIMAFEYTYNGRCRLTGIPGDKKSQSKTDKSIQGLINNTSRNETTSYEAKNLKPITIGDGHQVNIFSGILASNKDTKAMIHVEVNLETTANTPADEYEIEVDDETMKGTLDLASIWQGITDAATKAEVTYLINSEEANLHPIESYIDGRHVLHLMYILGLKQGIQTYFDILMRATGGTIQIKRGGLWYYALGVGLVGDGKWDGTIKITEEAADFDLTLLGFDAAAETVTVSRQAPEVIPITQAAADFDLIQLTFETAAETVTVTFHNDMEPRITEDGEERITEDGEALYTEGE